MYWPFIFALVGLVAFGVYWFLQPEPPTLSDTPERSSSTTESFASGTRILLPPPTAGKITFVASVNSTWQVFTANPDGTGVRQLTSLPQPGAGDPAISPDGSTIAFVNDSKNIYTIRTDGSQPKVIYRDEVEAGWPSWSPDSEKIVFASRRSGSLDLFIMSPDGTELVQLTDDPAKDQDPVFSPDGRQIAFSSNRSGSWEIYILTLDSSEIEQITDLGDPDGTGWPAWSPNGLLIAFESIGESDSRDIYTIKPDGTQLKNVTNNPAYDGAPAWSPDGEQIAFVSDRDNALSVHVMQGDGTGSRRLTELWAWGPSWSTATLLAAGEEYGTYCAECHGSEGDEIPAADLSNPEVASHFQRPLQIIAMLRRDINGQPHMGDIPLPSNQEAANIAEQIQVLAGREVSQTYQTPEAGSASAQGVTIEATATEAEATSEANLRIGLEPFSYTLEDAGGGWNEGRVELAIANKTDELIWFEKQEISNIVVETEEGSTYPATLYEGYESQRPLNLHDLSPLLPGFRLSSFGIYPYGGGYSFSIVWRSATTTNPKRVVFPGLPELDFNLPAEKEKSISFPFVSDPVPLESFASLAGVSVPGQLSQIQAIFTGRCYITVSDIGELRYWVEFSAKNTDAFNETQGEVQVPYVIYYSDGYYQRGDRADPGFGLFGKQEGAKSLGGDGSNIALGPDQSATGHIIPGLRYLEYVPDSNLYGFDAITAVIALFLPDKGYVLYDDSACELVE